MRKHKSTKMLSQTKADMTRRPCHPTAMKGRFSNRDATRLRQLAALARSSVRAILQTSAFCLMLFVTTHSAVADPQSLLDFEADVKPILSENCWGCHGEDEQESNLRLDRRSSMLQGGDLGFATIVPGKPRKSYLLDVVKHLEAGMEMPPDSDRLDPKQIATLERWVAEGAIWPGQMQVVAKEKSSHWSFQPILRPEPPKSTSEAGNVIDAFLQTRLARGGLSYSKEAAPRVLLRRLSIVLTGLTPTREETAQFLQDWAEDRVAAYQDTVERLLASPHFGERWAQHWLDVIRWAETNGSESNMYRKNAWL